MNFVFGFRHLNSSYGLLKILHLFFGIISLILVEIAYVDYWALDVFLITVSACFLISLIYLILHVVLGESFTNHNANRVTSCVYHLFAGIFLIIAGIDLIGWSDYDKKCGIDCPHLYTIGVAKIITFVNGTLYGIHGFLEAKGSDDEDFYRESLPLIRIDPPSPTQSYNSRNSRNLDISYQNINYS